MLHLGTVLAAQIWQATGWSVSTSPTILAELFHQVKFPQALVLLHQLLGRPPLLQETVSFYRLQLHRHAGAVAYLLQRGVRSPELIEHMRIGYAPGGCLRGWLTQLGYPLSALRQAGLVTTLGYDTYIRSLRHYRRQRGSVGECWIENAPPNVE